MLFIYLIALIIFVALLIGAVIVHMSLGFHRNAIKRSSLLKLHAIRTPHLHDVIFSH